MQVNLSYGVQSRSVKNIDHGTVCQCMNALFTKEVFQGPYVTKKMINK